MAYACVSNIGRILMRMCAKNPKMYAESHGAPENAFKTIKLRKTKKLKIWISRSRYGYMAI